MTHEQIIGRFVEFAEGSLAPADRAQIERHLSECPACRRTYRVLRRVTDPKAAPLRQLTVDPFLPTRIRALAEERGRAGRWKPAVRVSFASLAVAAALSIGVYLGYGLSHPAPAATDDVFTELAASVSPSTVGDSWQSVLNDGTGGSQ